MPINKNSLQARINNYSNKTGVHQNILLKTFFFDSFLKRLAVSKYTDNFVFKGGFFLSSNLGIDLRSTMDIDFLLKKISLERENIINIFNEISSIDINDGINFEINNVSEIRLEDEYGGFNITLLGRLENIREMVDIDVATGDPITPNAISYQYKCLFDGEVLNFKAYNFETIIAEKLQTILVRGITNSRCKDFYDLYIINKLKWETIDIKTLKKAYVNTCEYRNTFFNKDNAVNVIYKINNDSQMGTRWNSYRKRNKFVGDITFKETIEKVLLIVDTIYGD